MIPLGSVYATAEMAAVGFCIAQNLPIPEHHIKKTAQIEKFAAWFREHADWFIDPLDIKMMQIMLTQLSHYSVADIRRTVISRIFDTTPEKEVQNWYTKYTMFDPTMGMYEPDQARAYFRQRMLKRLNMVAYMLEKPPRARR
ncbi:MAG: hypothetical protein EOO77_43265 [Oxalobacteraceae bacterium]|nr:MAG: hypothetical protein EOO77_43265 [Oxalobacteraceae bacterium]